MNWQKYTIDQLKADSDSAIAIGPFGSRMKSDTYVPIGVPVIRGNNISETKFFTGEFVFITPEFADQLKSQNVTEGDLVFPHRGNIGTVGIVGKDQPRYVLSTSLMKLTCNRKIVSPLYLFYFFRSPAGRHELLKHASTVGTPGIGTPLTSLRSIRIRLPPISVQERIADALGSLDDKIECNNRMNRTLEAMARAIFQSWFVDFDPVRAKMDGRAPAGMDAATAALFPDHFEDSELGKIPAGWRVQAIGEVVRCVGGATPSTKEAPYWDGNIPFATPKDLAGLSDPVLLWTERCITEQGLQQISSGLLPVGTVLMSSRAPIGYLALAEVPIAVNQGFIAMICDGLLPNYYVLHWARENMDIIMSRANGTTFLEISKTNFRPIEVVVPPPAVLNSFCEIVAPLHKRVVANLKESRTLAVLRDTLLPKLISGELRVPEAERSAGRVGP